MEIFKQFGKNVGNFFTLKKIAYGSIFIVLFIAFYIYHLGRLIPGNTRFESANQLMINGHDKILQHISLAPIKFLEFLMLKIDQPNSTLLRLVSVFFIFIALVAFYKVVFTWRDSNRMALISTFLLGISAYVLHIGHFASNESIYLCVIPLLILVGIWLKTKKHLNLVLIAFPIIALLLYIPGIWFVLACLAFFFRKRMKLIWKFSVKKYRYTGIALAIILLIPMIYSIILYPGQISEILGIDRLTNEGLIPVLTTIRDLPIQLFVSGIDHQPQNWLKGTPIIDVVSVVFIILGIVAYKNSNHTLPVRLVIFFTILSILIIGLSTNATIALILPVLYLLIGRGIAYTLQNWFAVFPYNPIARGIGITLLMIPIALISYYNYQNFFHAWRQSPETIKVLK